MSLVRFTRAFEAKFSKGLNAPFMNTGRTKIVPKCKVVPPNVTGIMKGEKLPMGYAYPALTTVKRMRIATPRVVNAVMDTAVMKSISVPWLKCPVSTIWGVR